LRQFDGPQEGRGRRRVVTAFGGRLFGKIPDFKYRTTSCRFFLVSKKKTVSIQGQNGVE
jgi:hypothetical protein